MNRRQFFTRTIGALAAGVFVSNIRHGGERLTAIDWSSKPDFAAITFQGKPILYNPYPAQTRVYFVNPKNGRWPAITIAHP